MTANSRLAALVLVVLASGSAALAAAAAAAPARIPTISARTYKLGTAHVIVTGSFAFTADITLNTPASMSDGEDTWLQYGASGSDAPNALLTVHPTEIGLIVGQGKSSATAGNDECQGKLDVTPAQVSGHYVCKGVTSYDPRSGKMGTISIDISLTADTK